MTERQVVDRIALHMQVRWPDVVYRFDLAADIKLTVGQAARHKRLHPKRGYPDLFIAASRTYEGQLYGGLFLELKKPGTHLTTRDGRWVNEHIAEQAAMREQLADAGYVAQFAIGADQAIEIIDSYLGASS